MMSEVVIGEQGRAGGVNERLQHPSRHRHRGGGGTWNKGTKVAIVLFGSLLAIHSTLSGTQVARWSNTHPFGDNGSHCKISQAISLSNDYRLPELVLTNFGWNQLDATRAAQVPRCMAAKEFSLAIEGHERYNASAWNDLDQNPDANRPIIAFLDVDTIGLLHWPKFGGDQFTNSDLEGGRPPMRRDFGPALCHFVRKALSSPAMSASPDSRLIVLNGDPDGPSAHLNDNAAECVRKDRNQTMYRKLIMGHMSAHKNDTHEYDFGLPSWPVRPVMLSKSVIHNIKNCQDNNRTYLFSFQGRHRPGFEAFNLYMEEHVERAKSNATLPKSFVSFGNSHYDVSPENNTWGGKVLSAVAPEDQAQNPYSMLLMQTTFCPTPRGDKLYSVRFAESMSAACIPVILADGWILPYNNHVVDWSNISILLPQKRVTEMATTLSSISIKDRCRMQQQVLDFYNSYVKDSHGRLRAILKLTDARIEQERLLRQVQHQIMRFNAVPDE